VFVVATSAGGTSNRLAYGVPEYPGSEISVLKSSYASAGQLTSATGLKETTFAAPMFPVSPDTVSVAIAPAKTGFGEVWTLLILFEPVAPEASMQVIGNVPAPTAVPSTSGSPW
jgi:hypothetical protein